MAEHGSPAEEGVGGGPSSPRATPVREESALPPSSLVMEQGTEQVKVQLSDEAIEAVVDCVVECVQTEASNEKDEEGGGSGDENLTLTDPMPLWRLIGWACGGIGIQCVWSIQNGNASSYFITLGLPSSLVGILWLAGPVAGAIMQPIAGNLSDNLRTPIGRRRPLIFIGLLVIALAAFGFTFGGQILKWTELVWAAILLALPCFWILDFAINLTQAPLRALLSDLATPKQQTFGASLFATFTSIGNVLGYGVASLDWTGVFTTLTQIQSLYLIALCVATLTIGICCAASNEKKIEGSSPKRSTFAVFVELFRAIKTFPRTLYVVFLVSCCCWFAWFTVFLYATVWMGHVVYGGDPTAPEGSEAEELYNEGLRAGNTALAIQSAVSIVYGLLLPTIIRCVGYRVTIAFAQAVQAVCLMLMVVVTEKTAAVVLIASLGVNWATTFSAPYALTAMAAPKSKNKGLYLALMYVGTCVPEMVAAGVGQLIMYLTHSQEQWVLFCGGAVAAIGVILPVFIPMPEILRVAEEATKVTPATPISLE